MDNPVYRARLIELAMFFIIIGVGTLALLLLTLQFITIAPPHAGVVVDGDASERTISIDSMGHAQTVSTVVNGTTRATLENASDEYTVQGTPNQTRRIQIISDNGQQQILLQEFYV